MLRWQVCLPPVQKILHSMHDALQPQDTEVHFIPRKKKSCKRKKPRLQTPRYKVMPQKLALVFKNDQHFLGGDNVPLEECVVAMKGHLPTVPFHHYKERPRLHITSLPVFALYTRNGVQG